MIARNKGTAKVDTRLVAGILLLALYAPVHVDPALGDAAGSGISYEEYLFTFPPSPSEVHAERVGEKIVVSWKAPAASDYPARTAYDPVVAIFRVYRIGRNGSQTLIGETRATQFEIEAPRSGARYAVTTVQRSGQESGLSKSVQVKTP